METRRAVAIAAGAVLVVPAVAAGPATGRWAPGAALGIVAMLVAGGIDATGGKGGYVTGVYAAVAAVPLLALAGAGWAAVAAESPGAFLVGSLLAAITFSPFLSVLVAAFAGASAVAGAVGAQVRGVDPED